VEWQGETKTTTVVAKAGEAATVEVSLPMRAGQLVLHINQDEASVQVDGKAVGKTPFVTPLEFPPGDHQVIVEWRGQQKTANVVLAEGKTAAVELNFPEPIVVAKPPPPPAPSPRAKWYRKSWVWVAAGAVVASVGVTLAVIYGRSDHYPTVDLGSQPIGH
jgi:hypothetical protein